MYPESDEEEDIIEENVGAITRSQTGIAAVPLKAPMRLVSWNMQRGGKGGKAQRVRNFFDVADVGFILLQEISQRTFDALCRSPYADDFNRLFSNAKVKAVGLGQAMFVRKSYFGEITNQTALDELANGRSNLIWRSSDGRRAVIGTHCLSGRNGNEERTDHIQGLLKHCSSTSWSHIVCGDLNQETGFPAKYVHVVGGKHLAGSCLDGCLTASVHEDVRPYVESVGAGGIHVSDHPLCEYLVTWQRK